MRLALAIGSFVILIVHGIVFYKQFFHKWENYQTAYFDQARSLAKTDSEKTALGERKPRIEQHIVTQFGDTRVVVDGQAMDSDGKTDSANRTVSLDAFTVAYLRRHVAMLGQEREVRSIGRP